MNIFRAIDRKLKENISKSCSFFKKIVKLWKNDLTKLQQLLCEIFLQFVIFSTISFILLQYNFSYLLSFWANKWNTSHWVNYANIRVFSDTCFPVCIIGFYPYTWKFGSEKTFIFAYLMQCPAEFVSNLETTFIFVALEKYGAWSTKLAALISSSAFFLVATSNSVHLW